MKTILFANQKGGAGKTVISAFLGTYFYYVTDKNFKIEMWDIDDPQFSLLKQRYDDKSGDLFYMNFVDDSTPVKKRYLKKTKEKDLYPIYHFTDADAMEKRYSEIKDSVHLLIIDSPGSLQSATISMALGIADLILVPTSGSQVTDRATSEFVTLLKSLSPDLLQKTYLFFNRVDTYRRSKKEMPQMTKKFQGMLENMKERLDEVNFMDSFIGIIKDFDEELITLVIPDMRDEKYITLNDWTNEIISLIKK